MSGAPPLVPLQLRQARAPRAYPRVQRWLLHCAALSALVALLLVAPHLGQGVELVRLRNALLLAPGSALPAAAFDWPGDAPPPGFAQEQSPPNALFQQTAQQLQLAALPNDWSRVLAISTHLLSHPVLRGAAIHARLDPTYRAIVQEGRGYCGDFTRVFVGLALAAGLPVRAWSFSMDGFGGHGHTWPEVWNRQLQQWQLVDIFNNSYVARGDGVALSALALRQALTEGDTTLRLLPLVPGARPGYAEPARAWAYYRNGLPEWYMAWGNAVFTQDRALLVRSLSPLSVLLAQLGAVLQGVSPHIHVLDDAQSAAALQALQQLRLRLLLAAALLLLAALALLWSMLRAWQVRHAARAWRQTSGRAQP